MGGHSDSEGMELELELAQEGEHKVIQHWIEVTELLAPRSSVHHATVMFAFEGVIDAITPEAATKLRGDLYGARVRVGLCASSHTSLHKLYDPCANYAEFVRGTWFQVFVDQQATCVNTAPFGTPAVQLAEVIISPESQTCRCLVFGAVHTV